MDLRRGVTASIDAGRAIVIRTARRACQTSVAAGGVRPMSSPSRTPRSNALTPVRVRPWNRRQGHHGDCPDVCTASWPVHDGSAQPLGESSSLPPGNHQISTRLSRPTSTASQLPRSARLSNPTPRRGRRVSGACSTRPTPHSNAHVAPFAGRSERTFSTTWTTSVIESTRRSRPSSGRRRRTS